MGYYSLLLWHLTKESFQNKNTSAQSRLGEHGPLMGKSQDDNGRTSIENYFM